MFKCRIICKKDVKTFSGVRILFSNTGQILNRYIDRSRLRDINNLVNWVDIMDVLKQRSVKSSGTSYYQSSDEDQRSPPSSSLLCSSFPLNSSSTSGGNNVACEYRRSDKNHGVLKQNNFLGFDTTKKRFLIHVQNWNMRITHLLGRMSRELYIRIDRRRQPLIRLNYYSPKKQDELYSWERSMEPMSLKRKMDEFSNENPKKPRCFPVSKICDFSPSKLLRRENRKRKREGFASEDHELTHFFE